MALDSVRQDVGFALRTFRAAKGFFFTAVLLTALGIGAATTIYTLADHVLLRPLPFPDSDRLVKIWENDRRQGYTRNEPSPAIVRDWRERSRSFESIAAYALITRNLVDSGDPEQLEGVEATPEVLALLRPKLVQGSVSTDESSVLLSHELWAHRFGQDPGIVGRKLTLGSKPYTVAGVLPADFPFPAQNQSFWIPLRFSNDDLRGRGNHYLRVFGKLREGVSFEAARSEMDAIGVQLAREFPENREIGVTLLRMRDDVPAKTRTMMSALVAAAFGVLLIACCNLSNLLLARSTHRSRELSIREALGASRQRLIRQLLTESVALALVGGTIGIASAYAITPLLSSLVPDSLPVAGKVSPDIRVVAAAMVLTVAFGIAFGILPALKSGNSDQLRQRTGRSRDRLRPALVFAEVAVSVVLLVCSGLLARALWQIQSVDPGFQIDNVLTMRTWLPTPKYDRTLARERFYNDVLTGVQQIPGVRAAGYTSFTPLVFRGGLLQVKSGLVANQPPVACLRFITPGYLDALEIPVKTGRGVLPSDTGSSTKIAVVSESFVAQHWPGQYPIGRQFEFARASRTVVGVVGNVKFRGFESPSEPQVYLPSAQMTDGDYTWFAPKDLIIRTSNASIVPAIRRIVAQADSQQPVSDVKMLSEIVDANFTARSVQLRLVGVFAISAFLLAGIGLHGVLSFAVTQRRQEIGIRMAVGATPSQILGLFLRSGLRVTLAGITAGLALSWAASRTLESVLAGIKPTDAPTYLAAIALCLLMGLIGSLLPAMRATRYDPAEVIRQD